MIEHEETKNTTMNTRRIDTMSKEQIAIEKSCANCNLCQTRDYTEYDCFADGEPKPLPNKDGCCPFWEHDGVN